jgi:predicted nucleic acid-binding protein
VLASAVRGAGDASRAPGEIYRRWRRDEFVLVLSSYLLDELTEVFRDRYFVERVTKRQKSQFLWALRNLAEHVKITDQVRGIASHPEDDPELATAVSATVDYLVTGDK